MSIVTEDSRQPAAAVSPDEALCAVMERLEEARRRIVRNRLARSVFIGAATVGLAAILMAIADFWWELPTAGRALWLIVVAICGFAAFLMGCKQVGSYSIGKAAADVERQIKAFGQRLRTTHDYQEPTAAAAPASTSLLDGLRGDTYAVGGRVDWDDAVDARPLIGAVATAGVIAAIWAVSLAVSPEFRTAGGRVLLLPWEYTTVTYDPQASTVRPGESVEITVAVSGRPVDSARLRYRLTSSQGDWETLELAPLDGAVTGLATGVRGRLGATLADLEQDVEFEVLAGPRRLPTGSIRVLVPLTLDEREARVIPPAYTGRDEQTLSSLDVKVPEGSTVELRLVLNRPASEARLVLADSAAKVGEEDGSPAAGTGPVQPRGIPLLIEGNTLRGHLADLRTSVSGIITARAADEMTLDPEPLEIRVQIDRKPELQFIEPAEELVVTPTTEVPIQVEVKDDIGLHKMGILFQIGDGPVQTLWEEDARGSVDPRQMASVLMLEEHSLGYQDGVTYHAFAEDNYFGQPRRTTTPLRFVDIRPFKMAYQLVDSGGT